MGSGGQDLGPNLQTCYFCSFKVNFLGYYIVKVMCVSLLYSYNHHHNQGTGQFYHPRKFSHAILLWSYSTPTSN